MKTLVIAIAMFAMMVSGAMAFGITTTTINNSAGSSVGAQGSVGGWFSPNTVTSSATDNSCAQTTISYNGKVSTTANSNGIATTSNPLHAGAGYVGGANAHGSYSNVSVGFGF